MRYAPRLLSLVAGGSRHQRQSLRRGLRSVIDYWWQFSVSFYKEFTHVRQHTWLDIFGLIAGAIARLLVPGRDPMGWIATMLLGIVGSVVGGMIAYLLRLGTDPYQPAGWIFSIIGAVVALLGYYWVTKSKLRA